MRIIISLLLSLLGLQAQGQFRFAEDRSIPVSIGGTELPRPWEGGINSAQYQKLDLNDDDTEDLVIFHRMSGTLTTYLAVDNEYVFSPEYAVFFPEEVSDWLILADYNCDGLKDIFTSTPLGIKVFENTSSGNALQWTESVEFIQFNDNNINLQVNASDIPGIADMDGDGDLDIIAYRFSSASTIDYFRNMSVENTGSCGELTFIRENRRWGDLEECTCGSFAFGQTCASLGGVANPQGLSNGTESVEHAGGKTLLLLDIDEDGDMDLITSDEFCETLYFMENEGTPQLAVMTEFSSFPTNAPAGFYIFPSAFFEDLNFDGEKDLIISTNADNNIGNQIDFKNTSRFSINQGTTELPVFSNTYTYFLQPEMIDLGETTYPTFVDVDGDSDMDLIVGTRGNFQGGAFTASLYLFENVGTPLRPAFNLIDEDYLGLSIQDFRNLKPQAIDLDGDGDLDLAYQATENNGNRTALRYRLNQGNFELGDENEVSLTVSENNQFHFANIDGDNQPDLLIGSRLGSITYYRNEGNMTFGEGNNDFAGITNGFETRSISLLVTDLNRDGNAELVTTDISGQLKVLSGALGPNFVPENTSISLVDHPFFSEPISTRLGAFSPIAAADLFGDGRPALVVGNNRGGLQVYRNLSENDGGTASAVRVFAFPNPTTGSLFLQSSGTGVLNIYSLSGQRIGQDIPISSTEQLEVSTSEMPAGIYLFRVTSGSQAGVVKVIVQR